MYFRHFYLCIVVGLLVSNTTFAQLSAYTFSAGTAVSLTDLTGATTHGSGTNIDDQLFSNVSIGFAFRFNGVNYTSVTIDANGALFFGTVLSGSTTKLYRYPIMNVIGSGGIALLGADLRGTANGRITSKTIGSSPNRQFIVQWLNWGFYGDAGGSTFSAEITLNENGSCTFEYGTFSLASTFTTRTPQVGLRGATTTDVHARTGQTWSNTILIANSGYAIPLTVSSTPQNRSFSFAPPTTGGSTGSTPTITQPASTTQLYSPAVTVAWSVVSGASGYNIQVSSSPQFSSYYYNTSPITGTQVSLGSSWFPGITSAGTTFYARAQAVVNGQAGVWSAAASFKVGLAVSIESVSPSTLTIGQTASLTVNGKNTNFTNASNIRLILGGTTIAGTIANRTTTSLVASFAIPASAPSGTYTLSVDNAPGTLSTSVGIFAQSVQVEPPVSSQFAVRSNGLNFCNCVNNVWPQSYWGSINYNAAPYTSYPVEFRNKATRADLASSWEDFAASLERVTTVYTNSGGTLVPTQQVINYWQPSSWGGSCYGFSVIGVLNYSGVYSASIPYSLQPTTELRRLINRHQAYQGLSGRNTVWNNTPNQTVQSIRTMLTGAKTSYQAIAIFNYVNGQLMGGHSVVPYKITTTRDASNNIIDSVYVYDNNWPGDLNKAIIVNRTANTWLYPNAGLNATAGSNQPWGGNTGFMPDFIASGEKAVNLSGRPVIQSLGDETRQIDVLYSPGSSQPEITVQTSRGEQVVNTGKDLFGTDQTIQGAIPIIPLSGSTLATMNVPIGFSIPALELNTLNVQYKSPSTTEQNELAVNSGGAFSASARWISSTKDQPQLVSADFDNELFAVRSAGTSTEFSTTLSKLGSENTWENVIRLSTNTLLANDSVDIQLHNNGDQFTVTNYHSAKQYSLLLTRGTNFSEFKNISAGNNESHQIVVQSWADIKNSGVTLYVDRLNDGKIDTTIILRPDVVTSIKTEPLDLRLVSAKIYPNPASENITVEFQNFEQTPVRFEIVHLLGTVLYSTQMIPQNGVNLQVLETGFLPTGTYMIRVISGQNARSIPLTIVR